MPYIPRFTNDIFISYAHDNNADGWVTNFRAAIEREVRESLPNLTIWWDKDQLRGNTEFDREIEEKVKSSAILLAINSERYLASDYCLKELDWFYEAAESDGIGIRVGNQRRVFNVLKRKYDHDNWPERLKNISGNPFYDSEGYQVETDSLEFRQAVRILAKQIKQLLQDIKAQVENALPLPKPPVSPRDDAFTIYLCRSSRVLNPICNKLLAALQPLMNGAAAPGQAIQVKKDDTQSNTPLPHNEHDQIVIAEIKKADLVINLLNDDPGLAMIGLPEKTYIQRQVELGREYARNQLIWIKPDIDIESEDIEPAHSQFLQGLESNENSSVIRLSSSELSREVTEKITEIQQAQSRIATVHSAIAAALLNYHGNDEEAAGRLKRFLNSKGVLGVSGPEFDDPRLTMKFLEAQLDQVNRLICVYSEKVGRDWVSFRLGELLKMADQHQHEPQACGIYFVPPLNKAQHGNFRLQTRVPLYEFDSNDIDHLEEHPDDLAWLIGNIG